jgi:hypothetical protein
LLRALVVLLCLANLLVYAWGRGWLSGMLSDNGPAEHEPARLAQQITPQNITLEPPAAAASAAASAVPASAPTRADMAASGASDASGAGAAMDGASAATQVSACLQLGPYTEAEKLAMSDALRKALPHLSWQDTRIDQPGTWWIYMGRYATQDLLAKKEEELQRIHVAFEEVTTPPELALGLSLGRFHDRDQANQALAKLSMHGIRTARLVMLHPPKAAYALRFNTLDAATLVQLRQVVHAAGAQAPQACTGAASTPAPG